MYSGCVFSEVKAYGLVKKKSKEVGKGEEIKCMVFEVVLRSLFINLFYFNLVNVRLINMYTPKFLGSFFVFRLHIYFYVLPLKHFSRKK